MIATIIIGIINFFHLLKYQFKVMNLNCINYYDKCFLFFRKIVENHCLKIYVAVLKQNTLQMGVWVVVFRGIYCFCKVFRIAFKMYPAILPRCFSGDFWLLIGLIQTEL
jgi:hypothetical protein